MKQRGFTLVELIVVIVLVGILGGVMVMSFKPAVQMYLASGRRASLTHHADNALRRMSAEVRVAVPNSMRVQAGCIELVPTSAGGRYRSAPDTVFDAANPATPTAWLDSSTFASVFDVLSDFTGKPPNAWAASPGDLVVIGNQNTDDLYANPAIVGTTSSRAVISSVSAAPSAGGVATGSARISLPGAKRFPSGYEGGRFVIVPGAQLAVNYVCTNAGLDASGTGTGTLYRIAGYGLNPVFTCQSPDAASPVLATKVAACSFLYTPGQDATQDSAYVQVQLTLSDEGEKVNLSYGAHVDNMP